MEMKKCDAGFDHIPKISHVGDVCKHGLDVLGGFLDEVGLGLGFRV